MTDYGCGRCDCHHEMVDFRLRKKPRSSSGATRRPNLRLTLTNARTRSGSFSSPPCRRSNRRALGAVDLESARRPDERRGPSSKTKFTCSTCGQNAWGNRDLLIQVRHRHLQFSQIGGRQPYLIVRKSSVCHRGNPGDEDCGPRNRCRKWPENRIEPGLRRKYSHIPFQSRDLVRLNSLSFCQIRRSAEGVGTVPVGTCCSPNYSQHECETQIDPRDRLCQLVFVQQMENGPKHVQRNKDH
jgi:hypothetical protein